MILEEVLKTALLYLILCNTVNRNVDLNLLLKSITIINPDSLPIDRLQDR